MSPNLLHQEESANNGQALAMSALIEGTSDAEDIWEFYNNTAECLKDENPCLPINATPQAPSSDLTPRQIGHQKRVETLKRNKQLQHEQQRKTEALAQAQQEAESLKQAEALQAHRMAALERILAGLTLDLNANYLDFGDLLVYAFDPSRSGLGRWRSEQFWRRPESFWALMWHWLAARATGSGSKLVKAFSLDLVTRLFRHEARGITIDGCLKSMLGDAPVQATGDFALEAITKKLNLHCPTIISILNGACTSSSQRRNPTMAGKRRKEKESFEYPLVVSIATLALLQEYNQLNNRFQTFSSLFLYASGVSRQGISVISSYGNSTSYAKLIAWPPYHELSKPLGGSVVAVRYRHAGTLFSLSQACRELLRRIAAERPIGIIYDNINIHFKLAEQVIGKIDTLESGTCATAFELFKANPQDMQVSDLTEQFDKAPPLTLEDLQLSPEEAGLHRKCVVYTILDIIVNHGGIEFEKYRPLLAGQLPTSTHKREIHQDHIYPFPTMHIDESTVKGNIEICSALFKELGFDTSKPEFQKLVRLLAGDQLTIARLRAIAKNRMGHESGYESFEWLAQIIGLFHLKMAQTQGQTLLHRKPLPTPVPFRTARDLIRVSLYARILYCLLLVSGTSDLAVLAQHLSALDTSDTVKPTYEQSFARLCQLAEGIYSQYADRRKVYKLRQERKQAPNKLAVGDMIFEDSTLFLCDGLDLEEFMGAIKCGDSGRVLLSLKLWAFAFRANGRSKYTHEMLFLIHNITHVWSPALRDIVLNNWLINPTGKPNSHVELDLVQEHLIFWIKTMYKAHGSNASWEWLAHISPCVDFLRKLAKEFQRSLGDDQGIRHSSADLTKSIETLIRTFAANEVHTIKPGRNRAEGDGAPVVDTLTEGMRCLVHGPGGPIADFNQTLAQLQRCRKLTPVTYKPKQETSPDAVKGVKQQSDNQLPSCDAESTIPAARVRQDSPKVAPSAQGVQDVGIQHAAQTEIVGNEPDVQPQPKHESKRNPESMHDPESEVETGSGSDSDSKLGSESDCKSEAGTENSCEIEGMGDSDASSEAEGNLDLALELGDELGLSIFDPEGSQDDEALGFESDEAAEAESDADSLVNGL